MRFLVPIVTGCAHGLAASVTELWTRLEKGVLVFVKIENYEHRNGKYV